MITFGSRIGPEAGTHAYLGSIPAASGPGGLAHMHLTRARP